MKNTPCPCGSAKTYESCCGQYIEHDISAPTPEALMRSRYTAYSIANIDYIVKTMTGNAAKNFNYQEAKNWATQVQWLRLEVKSSSIDQHNSHKGFVEFKAFYTVNDKEFCLHENSEFIFQQEQWFYIGEKSINSTQPKQKVGRNDLCICGSGKKYKKCCGI